MSGSRVGAAGSVLLASVIFGCAAEQPPQPPPQPPATAAPVAPAPTAEPAPQAQILAELEVNNPSKFARPKQPLYVSYYDIGLTAADQQASQLAAKSGSELLSGQAIDHDGDGTNDGLMLLVNLAPGETRGLTVVADATLNRTATGPKLTQAEFSHKVGGKWQPREKDPKLKEYVGGTFQNVTSFTPPPEHTDHSKFIRYEGPGIESDKVGYRVYLDWRNGFDIFGKKVNEPVLQKVGQDGFDSYHKMADWGMDILKVGESLGAGGFGFWNRRKVELVSEVAGWDLEITNNGNLYSAFQITYKDWKVNQQTVNVVANFSMTGGSRLVHARLELSNNLDNLAIGMVKHPETELLQGSTDVTGKAYTYVASWGKQSLAEDMLGMAVLFPKGVRLSQKTDEANYVSVVEPAGKKLEYYFLAAWAGEPGGVQTKEQFVTYLEQEAEKLTLAPRVRFSSARSEAAKAFPITADAALGWSKLLADSELERKTLAYHYDGWDAYRNRKPKFEYDIVGLQPLSYDELNKVAPEAKYAQVMSKVTGSYVTYQGKIQAYDEASYNIDSIMPGRVLLRLHARTKQDKYKKAADVLRGQLKRHPKTSEGAFWHKQRYPWQLWLDGVYMSMPFLAEYSTTFENGKSLDEVVAEFEITRKHLRNDETGLYYHAWDEKKKQAWADPKTGLSKHHWGRGVGWFAMALVDTLDYIAEADTKHRKPLLDMISELAPALVKHQDASGTWWQILDMPAAAGNYREATATAMFAYFLSKSVRKGYLPDSYRASAIKAYEGMIKEFVIVHPDGKISVDSQCLVAGLGFGRDGSYHYYMSEPVVRNDPKGNGPFILAGVEMYRLLKR